MVHFFSAFYLGVSKCHTNIHELLCATLQKVSWQYMPFSLLRHITHLFIIFSAISVWFSPVKLSVMLLLCTCVMKGWLHSSPLALTWNKPLQSAVWFLCICWPKTQKHPDAESNTYRCCTTNLTLQRYPSSNHLQLQALCSSSYLSRQTKWFLQDNPSVSQERGCIFRTDECPNRYGYGRIFPRAQAL